MCMAEKGDLGHLGVAQVHELQLVRLGQVVTEARHDLGVRRQVRGLVRNHAGANAPGRREAVVEGVDVAVALVEDGELDVLKGLGAVGPVLYDRDAALVDLDAADVERVVHDYGRVEPSAANVVQQLGLDVARVHGAADQHVLEEVGVLADAEAVGGLGGVGRHAKANREDVVAAGKGARVDLNGRHVAVENAGIELVQVAGGPRVRVVYEDVGRKEGAVDRERHGLGGLTIDGVEVALATGTEAGREVALRIGHGRRDRRLDADVANAVDREVRGVAGVRVSGDLGDAAGNDAGRAGHQLGVALGVVGIGAADVELDGRAGTVKQDG